MNDYMLVMGVLQGRRPERPMPPECDGAEMTDDYWTLVQRCWSQDPRARPSMGEVVAYFQSIASFATPALVNSSPGTVPEEARMSFQAFTRRRV
jgi:hypothetical protein